MQGGLVRRLVPVLGETRLIQLSGLPFIAGLIIIALAPTVGALARMAGPFMPGVVHNLHGIAWPYLGGAIVAAVASLAALRLPTGEVGAPSS